MTRIMCGAAACAVALLASVPASAAAEREALDEDLLTPAEERALAEKRKREAAPVLEVSPSSLGVELARAQTTARVLTIRNAGGRTLDWTATTDLAGVRLSPARGTIAYGGSAEVSVEVAADGLPPGVAEAAVTVEAPGAAGSPARVTLRIAVAAPPEVVPGPPATPPPEEVTPPEVPPPVEPPVAPPREAGAARHRALGARAGALVPAAGDRGDYPAALQIGVLWRPGPRWELEITYDEAESESGLETRACVLARAGYLWQLSGGDGRAFYALGSVGFAGETVEDVELGVSSAVGSTVDVGIGATLGRFDARVLYSLLAGSANVPGAFVASVAVMF